MSTFLGNSGKVEVGGSVLGEVVRFSLKQVADRVEDTVLGDTNRTYKAGLGNVSGTIECRYDHGDAQQEALTQGAEVQLTLFPTEDTSGHKQYDVTATITEIDIDTTFNEVVPRSFTFEAAGALAITTIA